MIRLIIRLKENLFSDYYIYSRESTNMEQGEYLNDNREPIGYSILLNNNKVFPNNELHSPISSYRVNTLPQTFKYEDLIDGENRIEVRFFSNRGREGSYTYKIYKEKIDKSEAVRDGEFIDGYECEDNQWFGSVNNKISSSGEVVPRLVRDEGNDKFYSAKINDSNFKKIKILER